MKIQVLQHVPFEGPGLVVDWARKKGHDLAVTRLDLGDVPPNLGWVDFLVVMGGPMGVNDEARVAFLKAEKAYLREYLATGRPALGLCLGAQLLANVLGAEVTRNEEKEIGWFPVSFLEAGRRSELLPDESELTVFHWHGDTFAIPADGLRLAESRGCRNQAFLWKGNVLGLQFHFEMTAAGVEAIAAEGEAELESGGSFVQDAVTMGNLSRDHIPACKKALFSLLDRLSVAMRTSP